MSRRAAKSALVFVVESDIATRATLGAMVGEGGKRLLAFESGEEALKAIEGGAEPSLLFSSLRLPGMSGLDLLSRLVAKFLHVPVVLLTREPSIGTTLEAFRRGAADYFPLPLSAADSERADRFIAGALGGPLRIPGSTMEEIERTAILRTLGGSGGSIRQTSRVLKVSERTLHYRLKRYRAQGHFRATGGR